MEVTLEFWSGLTRFQAGELGKRSVNEKMIRLEVQGPYLLAQGMQTVKASLDALIIPTLEKAQVLLVS